MYANKARLEERAGTIPRRYVEDLDLFEVSIVDDRRSPCYVGTTIEQRADGEAVAEQRATEFRAVVIDNSSKEQPDYSGYDQKIQKLKEGKN